MKGWLRKPRKLPPGPQAVEGFVYMGTSGYVPIAHVEKECRKDLEWYDNLPRHIRDRVKYHEPE